MYTFSISATAKAGSTGPTRTANPPNATTVANTTIERPTNKTKPQACPKRKYTGVTVMVIVQMAI
jgi:hypothetical protein